MQGKPLGRIILSIFCPVFNNTLEMESEREKSEIVFLLFIKYRNPNYSNHDN